MGKDKINFIYKLVSSETKKCYIGSALNLKGRLSTHKRDYEKFLTNPNTPCLCSSIEIMKYVDVAIVEVEMIIGGSKKLVLERESYHILNTPNCVNKHIPIKEGNGYLECVCGVGCFRNTSGGVYQHIQGRRHENIMKKRGLMVDSIDGVTKYNSKDYNPTPPKPIIEDVKEPRTIKDFERQLQQSREYMENLKSRIDKYLGNA
jgi:predicted GIY-YIG superfamily endonuclease